MLAMMTLTELFERFPDGRPKVPDSILERAKGLSAEEEVPVSVFFRGHNVGDFRVDIVVEGVILIEL